MTFTERCRNQETSHLDDDPFFCFFLMDQIVLGECPLKNAKNFVSGLIVLGDLPVEE
jgi:hypothetical protein